MTERCYLVVDGGTSRTRVRLWHAGTVVDEAEAPVGAKDVALAGDASPIAEALRGLIETLRSRHATEPSAVVCSGMISSNVGLVEVPHVTAPIALGELSQRIVRRDVAAVTELPIYFVPGIKTVSQGGGWDELPGFDVMRGEEAEVVGLMALAELQPPLAFFHCGSHHKLIEVDDAAGSVAGRGPGAALGSVAGPGAAAAAAASTGGADAVVRRSSTAITGELLAAIRERTILASSLAELEDLEVDADALAAGGRHARTLGFARAAFLVRVGETIAGLGSAAVTSFLLGALADLDLQLIEHDVPPDRPVVLYGGGLFPGILHQALLRRGRKVRVLDRSVSEGAATVGAVRLLEAFLAGGKGATA